MIHAQHILVKSQNSVFLKFGKLACGNKPVFHVTVYWGFHTSVWGALLFDKAKKTKTKLPNQRRLCIANLTTFLIKWCAKLRIINFTLVFEL